MSEYQFFIEGNQWGVARPGFIAKQKPLVGFGASKELAVIALLERELEQVQAGLVAKTLANTPDEASKLLRLVEAVGKMVNLLQSSDGAPAFVKEVFESYRDLKGDKPCSEK